MKLAIMQPYFLPYIGYFNLISASDVFVIYDNIKYTKKGWINRNRLLMNNADATFSLPLRKGNDSLDVIERDLADEYNGQKLLNQFNGAYAKAPYYKQNLQLMERIFLHEDRNLFNFIFSSIKEILRHLDISRDIKVSSTLNVDPNLKAQDKVIAICKALGADTYINPIGGMELYSAPEFAANGIDLRFIRAKPLEYQQFGAPFVPWLSIMDVLMFNPLETVRERILTGYDEIR